MNRLLADPHSARLNPAERATGQHRNATRSKTQGLRSKPRRKLR